MLGNNVTVVSIDVDGPDLEIFSEIGFNPAVILLEGGFNFSRILMNVFLRKLLGKTFNNHYLFSLKRRLNLGTYRHVLSGHLSCQV